MRRKLIIRCVVFLLLAVLAVLGYFVYSIGPSNVWGMLRYDQRREGDLAVGDVAPDVELTTLDGGAKVRLLSHLDGRPLVIVFGSYT